ncbi:aldo/keto reductase [Treponema sp.]|uniref:aldo/keto reductase n=1 Tax=Treponema sp. TaxID=166 RepID=UPI0025E4A75C|nr:aldo/keto reductase [Treponema sp.]MCR5218261.1 aldo/keto reductase [Treponema sp.]
MEFVTLGKTNLLVSRTAFGGMSLDCKEIESAPDPEEMVCALVHQSYAAGINFFDVARSKPLCEQRLARALHGIRSNVFLASKTSSLTPDGIQKDIDLSLESLDTDTIDLYQVECDSEVPGLNCSDEGYKKLLSLKEEGIVSHIGLATYNHQTALEAVKSGLYETVQFPFNMLTEAGVLDIVKLCAQNDTGCIAMQPLNGGVLSNIPLAFGFLHQYENVVPVWGVHTQNELDQLLYFNSHPPVIDEKFQAEVEKVRDFFN